MLKELICFVRVIIQEDATMNECCLVSYKSTPVIRVLSVWQAASPYSPGITTVIIVGSEKLGTQLAVVEISFHIVSATTGELIGISQ